MDKRPNRPRVIQSADVFVTADGLIYSTDYNGGLYILEFDPRALWSADTASGCCARRAVPEFAVAVRFFAPIATRQRERRFQIGSSAVVRRMEYGLFQPPVYPVRVVPVI
jgi:hypothetical protein